MCNTTPATTTKALVCVASDDKCFSNLVEETPKKKSFDNVMAFAFHVTQFWIHQVQLITFIQIRIIKKVAISPAGTLQISLRQLATRKY